jgi:hypothetical protein
LNAVEANMTILGRWGRLATVIWAVVLLSLGACGSQPWTVSQSRDSITLRWWNDEVAATEAAGVANSYCSQMGKAMYLDGMEQHGSASVGRYRCI